MGTEVLPTNKTNKTKGQKEEEEVPTNKTKEERMGEFEEGRLSLNFWIRSSFVYSLAKFLCLSLSFYSSYS